MIVFIDDILQDEEHVTVRAIVEDSSLVYSGSFDDPPEYGSSMCTSSFYLGEDENLPENEEELITYLNNLDLDWEIMPKDWDY